MERDPLEGVLSSSCCSFMPEFQSVHFERVWKGDGTWCQHNFKFSFKLLLHWIKTTFDVKLTFVVFLQSSHPANTLKVIKIHVWFGGMLVYSCSQLSFPHFSLFSSISDWLFHSPFFTIFLHPQKKENAVTRAIPFSSIIYDGTFLFSTEFRFRYFFLGFCRNCCLRRQGQTEEGGLE